MLEKAKQKGVYKNCITALIGSKPIEGVERGLNTFYVFVYHPGFGDNAFSFVCVYVCVCVCVCVCVQHYLSSARARNLICCTQIHQENI